MHSNSTTTLLIADMAHSSNSISMYFLQLGKTVISNGVILNRFRLSSPAIIAIGNKGA